jgi:flagellar biosynthesis protein FlhG
MAEAYFDQAAGLRRLRAPHATKVVAVTGGKGGVGKTLTAVNLGAALAGLGRSTMLLDADFGLANVDVLLGMKTRLNLEHVMSGQCALEDIIQTASSGLRVVPATSGSISMASLSRVQHAGLIGAFSHLLEPVDVLLVDTAAGLNDGVLTFSEAAQRVVVLVCDEPASLTDAYGLIKVLCRRQPGCRFEIVANRVESAAHGRELNDKLMRVCHRFLGITPAYLGYLPEDDYVRQAIRGQTTVVEAFPSSAAARAFQRLARAVDAWEVPAHARGGVEFFMERLVRPSTEYAVGVH